MSDNVLGGSIEILNKVVHPAWYWCKEWLMYHAGYDDNPAAAKRQVKENTDKIDRVLLDYRVLLVNAAAAEELKGQLEEMYALFGQIDDLEVPADVRAWKTAVRMLILNYPMMP
jgi:hypothetical protein